MIGRTVRCLDGQEEVMCVPCRLFECVEKRLREVGTPRGDDSLAWYSRIPVPLFPDSDRVGNGFERPGTDIQCDGGSDLDVTTTKSTVPPPLANGWVVQYKRRKGGELRVRNFNTTRMFRLISKITLRSNVHLLELA